MIGLRVRRWVARKVCPEVDDAVVELSVERDQARAYADTCADALEDAIDVVTIGGVAGFGCYRPRVYAQDLDRWRRALRDGEPIR